MTLSMLSARAESHTPHLSVRDECDLAWFFSLGQIAFERSTFGGMLERAELFSVAQQCRSEPLPVLDHAGRVIGYAPALTARPTAEVREPASYVPDGDTLTRYAHISTLLKFVERSSRKAAQVLELLHGDYGQRWADTEPYGRLGALFHVTPKGQQLVEAAARGKNSVDLNDASRMEVIVAVQKVQPNADRAQALGYCQLQAKQLDQMARAVWMDVTTPLAVAARRG